MKFLADMPISPKTVEFLRSLGYEAIRVSERALDRAKDENIAEFAKANGMVILTVSEAPKKVTRYFISGFRVLHQVFSTTPAGAV